MKYLIMFVMLFALTIGCDPNLPVGPQGEKERYIVRAYSVDSYGAKAYLDSWGVASKPVKQEDGSYKFWNFFAEQYVYVPSNTEFILEGRD